VISPAAGDALARYRWPGNARELRRTVRQAAQRARLDGRDTIENADLSPEITATQVAPVTGLPEQPATPAPRADGFRRAGFTEREAAEIAALCATGFRVGEAEALLGYSSKSRTFSHRVRGVCLKALSFARFEPDAAAELLTGADPALAPLAARRLRALLESLGERIHAPDKVLTNLLTEHRRYALDALEHLRKRR
jgi:hypothetical protein